MHGDAERNSGHLLEVRHLSRSFGSVIAVDDASLTVQPGEFVAVLGPSGCGKTTLLRMVAGLTEQSSGEIWLDGMRIDSLPPNRRSMGFVFQHYALFPHMSVAGNVAFGLEMRRVPRGEIVRRVDQALALVQMADFGKRRVGHLSGGQQQRVATARALVIQPAVLLLDEPFSNLDAKLRIELRSELRELQRQLRITTVFVTHDQAEAMVLADRLVVMDRGRVVQEGTALTIFEHPKSRFVGEFVGRANFLPGIVRSVAGSQLSVTVGTSTMPATGHGAQVGDAVTVMVRPHRIRLGRSGGDGTELKGLVHDIRYLGDHVEVIAVIGSQSVEVTAPSLDVGLKTGDQVGLRWSADDAVILG